jgi:hypothetical protein
MSMHDESAAYVTRARRLIHKYEGADRALARQASAALLVGVLRPVASDAGAQPSS